MKNVNNESFHFRPLVIIGAGRSGTNILRDTLCDLSGFTTWPCDEINPIWRHGNISWPDDEMPPEMVTPSVRRFIRGSFQRIWCKQGFPNFVVEKTCANSLRVPFVDKILPEARFIYIVRDGYDVVSSALKRWKGELEIPGLSYYLSKARFAPVADLPRYAISTLLNKLAIKLGRQECFRSWGPRFSGWDKFSEAPLEEIVARQWAECVNASDASFAQFDSSRFIYLRYEDFTSDPVASLMRITQWLEASADEMEVRSVAASVRRTSVGKGRAIGENFSITVKDILEVPMRKHGYLK